MLTPSLRPFIRWMSSFSVSLRLQEGVSHLMREAGLALMSLVVEEEVAAQLAGERHQQHPAGRAHRWGKEAGCCVLDGQKVPVEGTPFTHAGNS